MLQDAARGVKVNSQMAPSGRAGGNDSKPIQVTRSGIATGFGAGWYAVERRSDNGKRFRWANGDATLPITLLDDAPRAATFTATIFSYNRPATVDLFLNEVLPRFR